MPENPAVIFSRKDALQDTFLARHAVDAFELALELGMGWGMLSGRWVDVALHWQYWAREPVLAQRLTRAVKDAARARLRQVCAAVVLPHQNCFPSCPRPVNAKSTSGARPLTISAIAAPEPQACVQPSVP